MKDRAMANPRPQECAMLRTATDPFVDAIRKHHLLDAGKIQELLQVAGELGSDAHRLAQHAIQRNWLTPYQINQLMQGKGANLQMGPYVLLDRLGQGGMAVVFKARHRLIDRLVAIKLIRPDLLKDKGAVARFRREVQAAALVSHPNIVLAYDADEVGGVHFFAMEYVDGITLAHLVKTRGALPISVACDYIRQATSGLAHVHEKGLVHRDIKPSNLMLTKSHGEPPVGVIKILDLGLARVQISDSTEGTDITRAGVVIGTPEFLAPEQAVDPHAADIRADLYSLGCTFYLLLTGQVPFPGGSAIEKLFKHRLEQPRPVEELREDIPPSVADIVEKLMAKKPEDRFQNPAELLVAFKTLSLAPPTSPFLDLGGPTYTGNGAAAATRNGRASAHTVKRAKPKTRPMRTLKGLGLWHRRWFRFALAGFVSLLLIGAGCWLMYRAFDAPAAVERKPLTPDEAMQQSLSKLIARSENPRSDARQLRQDLVDFRTTYLTSPSRSRAAELLGPLPSPLDLLNGQSVPNDLRFISQAGGDLVLALGDTRFRHGGSVWSLAISPDGKSIVTGGDDRMVYQWDAGNGNRQRAFTGPNAPITSLAWSADGKTVAVGSHDWTARLLDMTSGKEKKLLQHGGNVRAVAISPDSKLVATGAGPDAGKPNGPIRLWDMDGKELFRLEGHNGPVIALAFAPNGPWLASGGEDKTIRLWDLHHKKEIANLGGHQGAVHTLAFSADGHTLASGSGDKTLRLWDVGQRKERIGARDLGHGVGGVAFVPKSSLIVVTTHDGSTRLIDFTNGQEKHFFHQHGGGTVVAVNPEGQVAFTGAFDGAMRIWDLAKLKDIPTHRKVPAVQSLAIAPDDRTIATGHQGGRIRLWDAATGKEIAVLEKHQHGVPAVAFSPDGKLLLSGGWDHVAIVWDIAQRKDIQQYRNHKGPVVGVAFSPEGSLVGTASHDKTVRLWEPLTGKERGTLNGHSQNLHSLTFSPDGKTLASGAGERAIKLWDVAGAKERASLSEYTGESFAFLPDGKSLVSGSSHGSVFQWDTLNPKVGSGKSLPNLNLAWLRSLSLSPDGKTVAMANNDGRLILWGLASNKELRQFRVPGMATGLAFSGDGRHLLCVLNNGNACVLRLAGPRESK
jgi:WD40 repeat protein/tRNA A-37 threonylcarbamoyl transferase component Bud32